VSGEAIVGRLVPVVAIDWGADQLHEAINEICRHKVMLLRRSADCLPQKAAGLDLASRTAIYITVVLLSTATIRARSVLAEVLSLIARLLLRTQGARGTRMPTAKVRPLARR
jgi:hypothetical protein